MPKYGLGDTIPDIKVTDAEGHLRPLSEQMGARGLLIFVLRGTWCPFCVNQMASVQRNYHRYAKQGVESIFLTPEDEDSVWTYKISQPRPLQFGLHADPRKSTLEMFIPQDKVGSLPATYLLDRGLQVKWRYIGEHEEDRPGHQQLLDAIAEHLPLAD